MVKPKKPPRIAFSNTISRFNLLDNTVISMTTSEIGINNLGFYFDRNVGLRGINKYSHNIHKFHDLIALNSVKNIEICNKSGRILAIMEKEQYIELLFKRKMPFVAMNPSEEPMSFLG